MALYSFVTIWKVNAPLSDVWSIIYDSKQWPTWWNGVLVVEELESGDANKEGNVSNMKWKSILPYKLCFQSKVVKVIPMEYMEGVTTGQLEGTGRWYFSYQNGITEVKYTWEVNTNLSWMNLFAPLLKPFFKWNHKVVMQWGGEGLAKKLNTELLK
jgi:hypothetical protein